MHFFDRNTFPDFWIQYSKNMCSSMKFNSLFYATFSCVHFLPLLQLWFVFSYTLWNAFWQPPENVPELVPLSCGLQCRRQQQRNADRNSTLTTKEWFFSTGEKTKQSKKKKEQQINGASPVAELKLFISFDFSHPVYFCSVHSSIFSDLSNAMLRVSSCVVTTGADSRAATCSSVGCITPRRPNPAVVLLQAPPFPLPGESAVRDDTHKVSRNTSCLSWSTSITSALESERKTGREGKRKVESFSVRWESPQICDA